MALLTELGPQPVLASEHVVPVTAVLEAVLPNGGIQRGSTVLVTSEGVPGSTTLAVELLVGVSMSGSWCAVAGFPGLGIVAAAERGLELSRLLIVPDLGGPGTWQQVAVTLFDAVDAVLLVPPSSVRPSDARRLAARARDRRSVFVVLDRRRSWTGPADLRCTVTSSSWSGLKKGHGLLRSRVMQVEVSGRGAAARPRSAPLLLSA
jgi:hypothetical protein